MRAFWLQIVFVLIAVPSVAQLDTTNLEDSVDSRKPILRALPTAYYTPETRIALEVFAYLSFYSKGAERASNIRMFLAGTQNKQITLDIPWQIYFKDEKFIVDGKLDARRFPEYFYGIGNHTKEAERELYAYKSVGIRNFALKQIKGKKYSGITVAGRVLRTKPDLSVFDTLADMKEIIGSKGYSFLGIGPAFVYDARDVVLCPSKGAYLALSARFNMGETSEESVQFWNLSADLRQYFPLTKTTVLAYQTKVECTFGNTPYRELPTLGGPLVHRGYYFGRLRDNHLAVAQAEIRQHLFWRVGAVVFGSIGKVYNDDNLVLFDEYRPAGGGGLRFKLSKKDEANIRLDFAFTPDSRGIYVFFAEAF